MVAMIADKRFRLPDGKGWVNQGEEYDVNAKTADFHEKTGRGTRKGKDK